MEPAPLKKICTNQLLVPLDLTNPEFYNVRIRIGNEHDFQIPVFGEFSVSNVKEFVSKQTKLGLGGFVLILKGQVLHDGSTMSQYNIREDAVLHIVRSKQP